MPKDKMINGQPEGYWEWYRPDDTIKRSGYFENGEPIGEWITYDNKEAKIRQLNEQKNNCNVMTEIY